MTATTPPSVADATDPAPGVRARKKSATRDALCTAARRLVRAHGLDAVTVEQVCDEAGVARRTFFNYFEKKEDAALGWTGTLAPPEALAAFAAGVPHGNLPDDLAALVHAILVTAEFEPGSAVEKMELVEQEPKLLARQMWWFERELDGLRDAAQERRTADVHLDPDTVAFAAMTLLRTTARLWEHDPHGPVVEHLPAARVQLHQLFARA
ncbi:TetR/AcrR family transcriptional regulator [Luteimicrobium subarcticum]|uniref:TetR family transcriptional regulator n=1 Tax=Luteimicrobium subarcticum TaxID=620910 RepID=A0A2M8W3R2_9MICO|nr:TetR/AcrR family transcriptional regulator [Luteimicrobium subarcticum]PJI85555.1 TetR family transcriptional regulator [Luteimicrobium subarcticum]